MSNNNQMTMQNPLYGVQSAHFHEAIQKAHEEQNAFLRKLVETIFGRYGDRDDQAEVDKATAISADMLQYGRPF